MGWESNSLTQLLIITSVTPKSGLFVYSGVPAAGDLIASIVATGGTDPYGNATLSRLASYDPASLTAVALAGGVLNFYTAPSEAGPWTQVAQISIGSGDLVLSSNRNIAVPGNQIVGSFGLQISGGLTDQVALSNGLAAGRILQVANTTAAPTSPTVQLTAQAAADFTLGVLVAGDTNQRFRVDSDGSHHWGPGNAAVDTALARTAAGTLTVTSTLIATILEAVATAAGNAAVIVEVTGDTNPRAQVLGNGHVQFGPGNAAVDVTLQRNAGHLDVAATDGNTYSAERLTQVNTGQTITTVSPTLTALTGLSASVANGTTYRFRLWCSYQGSAAAGAPVFQVTGPATSTSIGQRMFITNGATATVSQAGSGFNSSQTGPTFQTAAQELIWEGIFTPSANGTLGVSGATNTSGDNLVINGAALDLFPVI